MTSEDSTALATPHEALNEPARDPIGTQLGASFTIRGVLGQGAMGVVYRAHQHSMDRDVAVKVLSRAGASDADTVRRFLLEGRTASRLRHPHVVTVFDFGQAEDGQLYLVMELLEGRTLADELDACGGTMPAERAVGVLVQVCDALEHAHDQGLVHRDLKPSNVFMLRDASRGRDFVKVLDFGVARVLGDDSQRMTRTGHVCGTPTYMSPEQALGDPLDARSDVYALGILAFELLTGVVPFASDSLMRVMRAHIQEPVPRMGDVSSVEVAPALEQVVRRALSKARAERPGSAKELAHELMAALRGEAPVGPALRRLPATRVARAFNAQLAAAPASVLGSDTRSDATLVQRWWPRAAILSFVALAALVIWHLSNPSPVVLPPAPSVRVEALGSQVVVAAGRVALDRRAIVSPPARREVRWPRPYVARLDGVPTRVVAAPSERPRKIIRKPRVERAEGVIE